jgi:hypothetical protein
MKKNEENYILACVQKNPKRRGWKDGKTPLNLINLREIG